MAIREPDILSCDDWGAQPATSRLVVNMWKATGIVIHHTATDNTSDQSKDQAIRLARSIQQDHIRNRKWGDSGQHFTISRGGFILEGRHGSLEALEAGISMISGAHTEGGPGHGRRLYNDAFIGIENEGNYELDTPPQELFDSLKDLYTFICAQYGISVLKILGHKILNDTACPGKNLFGQLSALRGEVSSRLRAEQGR